MRYVTFQSMSRTSSPGMYSRSSSKSIPRPLKWLRYAPTMVSLTSRFVRTSTRRTEARRSVMVMCSRHRNGIEDFFDKSIRRHCLRLRFVSKDKPMPKHIRADAFDIFRSDVRAALEHGPRFGSNREIDCGARRSAKLDKMLYFQFVLLRFARGEHEMDDVIADFVVHVNLVNEFARVKDFFEWDNRFDLGFGRGECHAVKNPAFFGE